MKVHWHATDRGMLRFGASADFFMADFSTSQNKGNVSSTRVGTRDGEDGQYCIHSWRDRHVGAWAK